MVTRKYLQIPSLQAANKYKVIIIELIPSVLRPQFQGNKLWLMRTMSVFEQLNPFVSLCQACGMIPYTVERNSATNKFEKFTFSFKHFTSWWFFFGLVLQVAFIVMLGAYSNEFSQELTSDQKMPVTVPILFGVTQLFQFAELLLSRWIVFRFRRLRNLVKAIQEVERLFGEKFLAQHSTKNSSVTIRFVIGFILVTITVNKHNKTQNY
jgi:uncharacterized membrane protein (DUF485 family)